MNGQESEPGSSGEDSGLMKSAALKIEPRSSGLRQRSCPMNASLKEGVRAVPPVSGGDSRSDRGENSEGQLPVFFCAFDFFPLACILYGMYFGSNGIIQFVRKTAKVLYTIFHLIYYICIKSIIHYETT